MSKTFTSRPAVTQGRGRGRGTQTRQTNAVRGTGMDLGARPRVGTTQNPAGLRSQPPGEEAQGQGQEIGQRMSYEGGYTKITPNMKKRQQINDVASRETEAYQAHKQQNTPKSYSYVGTAGGGQMSEGAARQKLIQSSPNKTQKLLQNQARKSFVKQKEEEELQMKKTAQRQKSIQNEQKKKQEDAQSANRWDEQRRRTNEAFLNRIESKNRRAGQVSNQTKSLPETQTAQGESSVSHRRLQPEGATAAPSERNEESKGAYSRSTLSTEENELTSDQKRALVAVTAICPNYPQETLIEILQQVDFSVDSAIMLLTD